MRTAKSVLIGAGSIALDTLEGPFGRVEDELGGSALYFALAASLIGPVRILAATGTDVESRLREVVADRDIDLELVSVLDSPTYRWHARQVKDGHNVYIESDETIYRAWKPRLPDDPRWIFIGSMETRLQLEIARAVRSEAQMLAADSMSSYAIEAPVEAQDLIAACDWFFCNEEEFAALGGDPGNPEAFRRRHGLRALCLKSGPGGVLVLGDGFQARGPALAPRAVVDTTGAGDALAAGFLARWLQLGGDDASIPQALAYGLACASLTIEDIGLRGLLEATPEGLRRRVSQTRITLSGGGTRG
ncbi:MAG TPA: PfkB family carbohydrate kinase [Candidatus Dormibacteraeota bacterium]|jgi:sugar/nucleoside kinase (ribokinase family)|nr:PfkB family carbohydrate kinase [Candidatus Dormibacteraeota bacterium]